MLHKVIIALFLCMTSESTFLDETDLIILEDEGQDLTDWTSINYQEKYEFDLETFPLQIKTNSVLGSGDKSIIYFWDDEIIAGILTIAFDSELVYHLSSCTDESVQGIAVPTNLSDGGQLWTIRKSDKLLTIECNDALVLQYKFTSSGNENCVSKWSEDILAIEFSSLDNASALFRIVDKDEFASLCAHSSCYPRWGNLLKGRRVQANSTCGQDGSEEYCLVSNNREEIMCGECDTRDIYKQHPASFMKDRRIRSRTTWWKSVNGEDGVTLQLDLETMFQFTHLIMVFYSFRPGAMVIERSTDYGNSWQPYQYFAYDCHKVFGMRERELGEPDEYGVQRHPDEDVICTSKYSYLEPAQGGEVIYKVIRGRPTTNTNRASLRNLLLLTNLRVRFVKLHTLGDDLWDPNDQEAKKKYFYAVEDWVVRGSCFCNGHSDQCSAMPGMEGSEKIRNMISGKCECQHDTAGYNCERCEDFHHSLPWSPGNPSTGEAHPCKKCSCNGHTEECEFDEQLYTETGDGGRCLSCSHSTAGAHCDTCVYGYHQTEGLALSDTGICQPCNCNEAGTTSEICASLTEGDIMAGTCICKANVAVTMKCDACKDEHYNIDASNPLGCTACDCDTRGTVAGATSCDIETGQCMCKENVEGQACDRCKVGYFNIDPSNDEGCTLCQCNSERTDGQSSCDQLTGACACKEGFSGAMCEDVQSGSYVPQLDHWSFDPENSGTISGEGSVVRDRNSSGSGYVALPDGSSLVINTDNSVPANNGDITMAHMSLPTGFYDLKIDHEPAESDYELVLQLDHLGKYSGTEPSPYQCAYNERTARFEQPYSSSVITVTVKAGSSQTILEDLCLDEGSQYNINIANTGNGSGGGRPGSLKIKDLTIVEPLDPNKAFTENPNKADLYREYQERGCPMGGDVVQEVDNECFRIKGQLEADTVQDQEGCEISLCLPELDIWNFNDDDVETGSGSQVVTDQGGEVSLPSGSSMTVPLDPGNGGFREIVLAHDPVDKNNLINAKVTIKHMGNKDGSTPKSYRCNGHLNRPYNQTTFNIKIRKGKRTTTIGDLCLDPAGDYLVTITPDLLESDSPDLVVSRVFVVLPDEGEYAFPHNPHLADLWDTYIEEGCPKIAGQANHDKEECVEIMNQINDKIKEDDKAKDCGRESCIPYTVIWSPTDPIDSLDAGAFVNPDSGALVLPTSGAEVTVPVDGAGSVTGSFTDLVIKHNPLTSPHEVEVSVVRTDSEDPYTCGGGLVAKVQGVKVTLQPLVDHSVVGYFCMDPNGEYTIRIDGLDLSEPIKINEIGSALPAHDPAAAFPENPKAAEYYQQYLKKDCKPFPDEEASQECIHLANLIDYHSDPARKDTFDCSVQFCYPTNEAFSPLTPKENIRISDGASIEPSDGALVLPSDAKVEITLDPLITGPNTIVIEYDGNNLPREIDVTIAYKGTVDGANIGEFKCRENTVKPSSTHHLVKIDPSETRLEFEACLVDNGVYHVHITFQEDGKTININKIFVELPRDTHNLFPADRDAEDMVDFLVQVCENQGFSAECATATQQVMDDIEENNAMYKVDCSAELCLPEDNVWDKGEGGQYGGNVEGTTDDGAVILVGGNFVVFTFNGGIAPKGGLNSLLFTINTGDYNRVVDVIITPTGGSKEDARGYEMCGEVSSAKQQIVRKVVRPNVAFVEVGPVCIDPSLQYDVQMIYKGVQPTDSDRIYAETSGINVIIESVDIVLPLDPKKAFPDNEEAANIWENYVNANCPRLSAGYREPSQECLDYLADLQKVVNNVAEELCQVTVCIDNSAGWQHDPTSDQEIYEGGADVSGGSTDAIILLPPGGNINIKTGEKDEEEDPSQTLPYTGVMDILVTHKKARYAWLIRVDVSHTKTKGDVIPTAFNCLNGEILPYSTQTFTASTVACTTDTRIPGVCVDKDNTYQIELTVLRRVAPRVECPEAVADENVFPVDQIALVFPEDPEGAFPDDPDMQDLYKDYLDFDCAESRNKACDDLQIEIMSAMSGQAPGCGCDMRGSLSTTCESVGGQCPCKEGYIGKHCNLCEIGYYGIDDEDGQCKECNCNKHGSMFDICDFVTGQCPCYDGVLTSSERAGLLDCSECADGYVGLENAGIEGCVACECGMGAALPNCDEVSGTCTCHSGVAQPLCDACLNGFYNLVAGVGCEACDCYGPGTEERGCDHETGVCTCKANVVGSKCDACKSNSFSISEDNPAGCHSCYCSGVTDQCAAAKGWTVRRRTLKLKWSVEGGAQERRAKYTIGAASGTEFMWAVEDMGNYYNSYSQLITVYLSGHDDNEVLIRLYRDNTYVTGSFKEVSPKVLEISLFEHNFEGKSGEITDLGTLRSILADITRLEITTIYQNSGRHDQKIKEFKIQEAVKDGSGTPAKSVEQCLCPEGYSGHACGKCLPGFAKDFSENGLSFSCVKCLELCNGYSNECDQQTGECSNCSGNTVGTHCDKCQEGFYPAEEDGGLVCVACPCSRNAASPSCSLDDGGELPVCDECENGYTGANCLDCAPGFYGSDGQCTACECNSNIDLSDPYSCNKEDGICQNCLYNTTGNECELCLSGFYGNALRPDLPKCKECGCDEVGSQTLVCDNFSGFCECLPHVTGDKCDMCAGGYWNLTGDLGCQQCECDSRGSVGGECDMETGQCQCKDGIQGIKCNECLAGYYNSPGNSVDFECKDCNCNMSGSDSTQCDSAGQCTCREGIVGMQCDRCARGTTGTYPDCFPCGECYDTWEAEVQDIEDEINMLAAKAQNIHLGAANLTEEELQEIFSELRDDLREAERLARSSPDSDKEIRDLTKTLEELSKALQEKSQDLDELNEKIDDIDQDTVDTLASLDSLNVKLDDFRDATNSLAEKAMTLSAANLDEALKIVEDAAERSIEAKQSADATKEQIAEALAKAGKAEKILKDEIFSDTSAVNKLNEIEDEISALAEKLGELDESVCGSDADSCEPCGGSKCGFCGGPGCGGAVGIISSITEMAGEARSCADARQREVTAATVKLRQHNNKADEFQSSVKDTKQESEETKDNLKEATEGLMDIKKRVDQMLQADRAAGKDIEDIIEDINALQLPLNEKELASLIDDLTNALNDINFVNADVDVSLPDKARIAALIARAEDVSLAANQTLDDILRATSDLVKFDEEYQTAQGLLQDTSDVVNEGWEAIKEIKQNREEAESSRSGLDGELDSLERELKLLLSDIASGDNIAQRAQDEIDAATQTVASNDGKVARLRKEYEELDQLITRKEQEVSDQLVESEEGARLSDQVESAIKNKLSDVEDLTEKYIVQQNTLVDLNDELVELELKLDEIMERIHVKASYHAQCVNDIAS